jgi:hypothetical protein
MPIIVKTLFPAATAVSIYRQFSSRNATGDVVDGGAHLPAASVTGRVRESRLIIERERDRAWMRPGSRGPRIFSRVFLPRICSRDASRIGGGASATCGGSIRDNTLTLMTKRLYIVGEGGD